MNRELDEQLKTISTWTNFNYRSHVLMGRDFGSVNHFRWHCKKNKLPLPSTEEDYRRLLESWQGAPQLDAKGVNLGGFTYAYPNHFSQNRLTRICKEKLDSQN